MEGQGVGGSTLSPALILLSHPPARVLQWEVPNFSQLPDKHLSEIFELGGYPW